VIREPRPSKKVEKVEKPTKKGRFRLVKLEERIAPKGSHRHCSGKTA
jgi:hypothetical protein